MSTFSQWNQALINHFFNEEKEGEDVRLAVDENLLEEAFPEHGGDEGFRRAVARGPEWNNVSKSTWRKHLGYLNKLWRMDPNRRHADLPEYPVPTAGLFDKNFPEPPPFLPYLALTCYVWTLDSKAQQLQGGANAYYVPFNEFFGYIRNEYTDIGHHDRGGVSTPIFGRYIMPLWEELENWANIKCEGKLGTFCSTGLIPAGPGRYVSVPRAQVLLTGTNRRRLGYLFREFNLNPGDNIALDCIADNLIGNPIVSRFALGTIGFHQATNNGDFSSSILSSIKSQLDVWDGVVGEVPPNADDGRIDVGGRASGMAILACLASKRVGPNQTRWSALGYVFDERHESGSIRAAFNNDDRGNAPMYDCRLGDNPRYYFHPQGSPSSGIEFKRLLACPDGVQAEWKRGNDREDIGLNLNIKRAKVRFFFADDVHRVNRNQFLRERGLPENDDGSFLVLVSHDAKTTWSSLFNASVGVERVTDFTWEGGPGGCHDIGEMWRVESVEHLDNASPNWKNELSVIKSKRNDTFARLIGGTRIGDSRRYLAIDPPSLVVDVFSDDIEVTCNGTSFDISPLGIPWKGRGVPDGELDEVDISSVANMRTMSLTNAKVNADTAMDDEIDYPDPRLTFDINIPANQGKFHISSVELSVSLGNRKKRFPIALDWKGVELNQNIDLLPKISKFGLQKNSGANEGLQGCKLVGGPDRATSDGQGSFPSRTPRFWHPVDDRSFGIAAYDFMSWLIARTSVTYQKAKQFLNLEYTTSSEINTLWKLGHIELGKDPSGRWHRVFAIPMCIYELPMRHADGRRQFVVSGTIHTETLKKLREVAGKMGFSWHTVKQLGGDNANSLMFIPRLELILSNDDNKVREAAQECNVEFINGIPAEELVVWSGDLDGWVTERLPSNAWQTVLPSLSRSDSFDPKTCEWSTNWDPKDVTVLRRAEDRVTRAHHEYQLSRPSKNNPADTERIGVLEREWAQWLVVRQNFKKKLSIPYDSRTGCLDFPIQLNLPSVLAKAMVLCSGYAPAVISRRQGTWPWDESTFGGARKVIRYHAVPEEIAKKTVAKVGASLLVLPARQATTPE